MTTYEKQFVHLLRAAVYDEKPLNDIDWTGVSSLARRHHLETIVWEVAKTDPNVSEDIKSELIVPFLKWWREIFSKIGVLNR